MKLETRVLHAAALMKSLGIQGDTLTTRVHGRRFYACLVNELQQTPPDSVVDLSFTGIELIGASFADEVFGVLAVRRAHREWQGNPFYLSALDQDNVDSIRYPLEARPEREEGGLRNCVVPVTIGLADLLLVGKVEENVAQTFNLLRALRRLTARDVADAMKVSIAAASNRLKALSDLGLALRIEMRDESGRQFIYRWLL